jgi:hypothetical protein
MGLVISVEPSHHPGSPVGSCKAIMKRYYYRLFHVTVHTSAKERTIWIQSNAGEPDSTNPSPPPSPIREIEQHRTMILTIMHNSTDVLWIQGFKLRPAVKDQGNPDAASGCRHAHLDLMLGPLCCPMTHWTAVFLHGLWNQGLEGQLSTLVPPCGRPRHRLAILQADFRGLLEGSKPAVDSIASKTGRFDSNYSTRTTNPVLSDP